MPLRISAACDTGLGAIEIESQLLKIIAQIFCKRNIVCNLTQTQADLCTSGIGKVEDRIVLLRLIAQLSGDLLLASDPGTNVTVPAILDRACTSGISKVSDELTLLRIIAQNGCELVP